jgi:hypothetical protein
MKTAQANVKWLTRSEGGRTNPPVPPTYCGIVQFEGEDISEEAWDLCLTFYEPVDQSMITLAEVKYRVDSAPSERLVPGARFQLLEGPRVVARGIILGE